MAIDIGRHNVGAGAALIGGLASEKWADQLGRRQTRSSWMFEDEFLVLALAPEVSDPEAPETPRVAKTPLYDHIDLATEELSVDRIRRAHGRVLFQVSDGEAEALLPYFEGDTGSSK